MRTLCVLVVLGLIGWFADAEVRPAQAAGLDKGAVAEKKPPVKAPPTAPRIKGECGCPCSSGYLGCGCCVSGEDIKPACCKNVEGVSPGPKKKVEPGTGGK